MDEKTINHLFEDHIKVSKKGTYGESGTGLGLQICKEFIELHNGKIWVESNLGIGSIFYISIPKEK